MHVLHRGLEYKAALLYTCKDGVSDGVRHLSFVQLLIMNPPKKSV